MPELEPQHLDAVDLALIEHAARKSGEIALGFFKKDPEIWLKEGDSPVTEADFAVNNYLEKELRTARPDYGWLSEESEDDPARLEAQDIFIIDPIDGTRSFIDGSEDWTISIGIVRVSKNAAGVKTARPVAAALFNPCRDEMYTATLGGGAFVNGKRLAVRDNADLSGAELSVSKPMYRDYGLEDLGATRTRHIKSLAYRIALVASGALSGVVARANSHDWDLAAADLLVHEAGGVLVGTDMQPIVYNREIPKHGILVAANEKLSGILTGLYAD